jgi:hypothetical protein
VLFVRPTERAHRVWHIATTFEALDAVLGGDKSSPLHELWQAWPDDDPKPLGVIAEWYGELDDCKKTEYACGEPKDLKPCALDLLQQMVKIDPAIVMTDESLLLQRLWQGTHSVVTGLAA